MSGISTEEHEAGGSSSLTEGMSSGQRCQSIDSLAEWRSSEQLENGIPSTSPPFWDTDDDDECGPKPSELYGKFTWKIENFRQLNKRELRSNIFEVGGYKWYILIYPQGCDVCNHLSLFLCVANHDKLLPGWSHFAQFTIAVVNKDPKKSKFSDTLHRFWKKEHDWGWKKFMEISKVYDGFVNDDNLVIKAEVQVIREKANRPFRCLDCQYRRELVRVYLSNVEQICRRFIEDRKNKLGKMIEDKMRWSSFHAFWTGIDQTSRRRMSRDKSDTILRVVVKHFFVEKEVTSTLVMDSLHSGLKALEHHSKNKKGKLKIEMEDSSDPMVRVEKDMFVLDDDVVLLLDRVASEPLPTTSLPPKDDKVSLNRAKEGSCCEEFNKESIERDERRLTELGQKTIEIFVVAHIFSRIEVAYQEAVALKRQEELIREEEAAGQAEHELKAKRAAADKEKRKKKQPKQKRNNRKSKDQQRDLRPVMTTKERQPENSADDIVSCELSSNRVQFMSEKMDTLEDASDVSYAGEDATEPIHPDLDDRDGSPVNWDTDASEVHPCIEARSSGNSNGPPEKRSPIIDDSSSTCSTDSVPSVVSSGPYKGFSGQNSRSHTSPNRGKNPLGKGLLNQESAGHFDDTLGIGSSCHGMETDAAYLKHSKLYTEKHLIEKREESATVQKKIVVKDQEEAKSLSSNSSLEASSASVRLGRKTNLLLQQPKKILESSTTASNTTATQVAEPVLVKEPSATNANQNTKSAAAIASKSLQSSSSKSEAQRIASIIIAKSTTAQPSNAISRPSTAPLIPAASRPTRPIISKVQKQPLLSRSVSAAGRLGTDPSPSTSSCVPQSYRNAIIGKTTMGSNAAGFSHSASVSFSEALSTSSNQSATSLLPASIMLPPTPGVRKEHQMNSRPTFTFGSVKPDALPNHHEWKDNRLHQAATAAATLTSTSGFYSSNLVNGIEILEICDNQQQENQLLSNTPPVQPPIGGIVDEFPHIDIINDLLDEEQSAMEIEASSSNPYYSHHHLHPSFGRQYSFPGDISSSDLGLLTNNNSGRYEQTEQYYDDGYQNIYSSSSASPLHRLREGQFPQLDLSASYAVGPMDGMVQIPWPYSHTDLSTVNLGSAGTDSYSYQQFSDYSSLGRGTNGYGMYRP
ncbi:hypothetical protein KFK09_021301 [Dendrobium nobile]|uniref:MATH domain-containing protein n=1 Tax=Dendrobium nobile TaxID=94219 RepID=A0A8T3APM0_DENNO|nr:hypothetical protein KFK09_021301 [Dendrobium nobile]